MRTAAQKGWGARNSALWGKGGRGRGGLAALCVTALLLAPAAAQAAPTAKPASTPAYLPGTLLADAQANPGTKFNVIVELKKGGDQAALAAKVRGAGQLKKQFRSIDAVAAQLPGALILALARQSDVLAITRDAQVKKTDFQPTQAWEQSVGADLFYPGNPGNPSGSLATPAIAVVDSGIDATRAADFGARVVASVNLSTLTPNATGDGAGHGTFVASIAAGSATTHPGVAPTANLVDLRVMDDTGMARTSDVIAAADWILQHKDQYGIRVANFSLMSGAANSFKFDPLDHAVEALWFNGVTVVAAAGNQGNGTRLPMVFAPANDPFVITVGAINTLDTPAQEDDELAPFSAYGYTADGFAKPELVAPGRYMTGAVSPGTYLYGAKADRIVEPGYLNISGTSFAAPVVAGAAADLLAEHPDWTPDQVKGALMVSAQHLPAVTDTVAQGMGEVRIPTAMMLETVPNPNAALDQFVVADPSAAGGKVFDAISWDTHARDTISWDTISWDTISWDTVSWSTISWDTISWDTISWDTISWDTISWDTVAFDSVSWDESSQAESALANVSWDEAADAN